MSTNPTAVNRDLVLSDKELQEVELRCDLMASWPQIGAGRLDAITLLAEVRRLRSVEHRQRQQIEAVQAACEGFSSVRVSVIQQAIDGEK